MSIRTLAHRLGATRSRGWVVLLAIHVTVLACGLPCAWVCNAHASAVTHRTLMPRCDAAGGVTTPAPCRSHRGVCPSAMPCLQDQAPAVVAHPVLVGAAADAGPAVATVPASAWRTPAMPARVCPAPHPSPPIPPGSAVLRP